MPKVNDGYIQGNELRPLEYPPDLSPHEKGEYRRAYWSGYAHSRIDDIQGCIKYANLANRQWVAQRLDELYKATLIEMYGEEKAQEFLNDVEDAIYARPT